MLALSRRRVTFVLHSSVEHSGPPIIKLAQWASTRRDLLSVEFCTRLSRLQRRTRQRPFALIEQTLAQTFGDDWRELFRTFDTEPIGSGCVAQVFKAKINPQQFSQSQTTMTKKYDHLPYIPVAVKV